MHYSLNPIPMFITNVITFITCITASILKQFPSIPSQSLTRLSHVLQPQSYNNVRHFHHHRNHVYHTHYSFNPISMSIAIAITSIRCITATILKQSPSLPSSSLSSLSPALQLRSYNKIVHFHHHRNYF